MTWRSSSFSKIQGFLAFLRARALSIFALPRLEVLEAFIWLRELLTVEISLFAGGQEAESFLSGGLVVEGWLSKIGLLKPFELLQARLIARGGP